MSATIKTADRLHAEIMNLPAKAPDLLGNTVGMAYKLGHRDARHAAAELALTSISAPVPPQEGEMPELPKPVCYPDADLSCGLSYDGMLICGSPDSIRRVRDWLHTTTDVLPVVRAELMNAREQCASLAAAPVPPQEGEMPELPVAWLRAEGNMFNGYGACHKDDANAFPVFRQCATLAAGRAEPEKADEVPASVKVARIMDMVRETRAEMEAAGEIVYRWMALDYSGYCYGSNPPDNLPARCNLKAFYAAENHPDDAAPSQPVGSALTDDADDVLSNLRHLYANMVNGAVRDTASAKRIATGLLGPAIEDLEKLATLSRPTAAGEAEPKSAQAAGVPEDTALLDWLKANSCDLRCIDVPTGEGDGDVHWVVIEHHMAKPHEREIGRAWQDEPRAAIRAAIGRAE